MQQWPDPNDPSTPNPQPIQTPPGEGDVTQAPPPGTDPEPAQAPDEPDRED